MNMLTPFLIFAIAVSHGEQMINRFRGELFFGGLEDGKTYYVSLGPRCLPQGAPTSPGLTTPVSSRPPVTARVA